MNSREMGVLLSSMTPRRRLETVESRANPKRRIWAMGGTMRATARRRSRRIWLISLRIRVMMRRRELCLSRSLIVSHAELHGAHFAPADEIEERADSADHEDGE